MTGITRELLMWVLVVAGAGQLILCLASPAIPVVLGWREQVGVLPKLLRQVFWTYACYILGSHLVFGLLSALQPGLLLAGDRLATLVSAFIAAWWGVRLVLHLTTFDTGDVPPSRWTKLAEWMLGLLFFALTLTYGVVWIHNLGVTP